MSPLRRLLMNLSTRRCRKGDACPDTAGGYHNAHLTWVGRWRYAGQKPVYLRFDRFHQVMVVAMALVTLWCLGNVIVDDGLDRLFQAICFAVDGFLTGVWWHWGVQDVKSREDRRAATQARLHRLLGGEEP